MNILYFYITLICFIVISLCLFNLKFRNFVTNIFLTISKYAVFVFYICIYSFFAFTYILNGYSLIPQIYGNSIFLIIFHQIFVFIILPLPWITFIRIYLKNPGVITQNNIEKYKERYPYDEYLYHKNTVGKMDMIPAVARSKYCDITKKRIAKYDHYCPWILSTIGEQTQKDFLLFIIFNIVNNIYFFYVTANSLVYRANTTLSKSAKTNIIQSNKDKLYIMFYIDFVSVFSCFVLFFVFFGLIGLLLKQIYHISTNKTAYECTRYQILARNKSLPKPKKNYYDKGFINNWKEAFTLPLIK